MPLRRRVAASSERRTPNRPLAQLSLMRLSPRPSPERASPALHSPQAEAAANYRRIRSRSSPGAASASAACLSHEPRSRTTDSNTLFVSSEGGITDCV